MLRCGISCGFYTTLRLVLAEIWAIVGYENLAFCSNESCEAQRIGNWNAVGEAVAASPRLVSLEVGGADA
jgi:hypothetical protein